MKRWLPFGLVALGVVLIAYALLGSSDEDRIRALLDRLAEAVRVEEGNTNPLVRHGQVNEAFKEIFAKEASASVAELGRGIHGREELVRAATQVGSVYRVAYVTLGDVRLAIDSAGGTAEVDATATITGARHGQETRQDERTVKIRVEKIEGDWRIFSVMVGARPDGE